MAWILRWPAEDTNAYSTGPKGRTGWYNVLRRIVAALPSVARIMDQGGTGVVCREFSPLNPVRRQLFLRVLPPTFYLQPSPCCAQSVSDQNLISQFMPPRFLDVFRSANKTAPVLATRLAPDSDSDEATTGYITTNRFNTLPRKQLHSVNSEWSQSCLRRTPTSHPIPGYPPEAEEMLAAARQCRIASHVEQALEL